MKTKNKTLTGEEHSAVRKGECKLTEPVIGKPSRAQTESQTPVGTPILDKLKQTICNRCQNKDDNGKCMVLKTGDKETKWYCIIHSAQEDAVEDVRNEIRKELIYSFQEFLNTEFVKNWAGGKRRAVIELKNNIEKRLAGSVDDTNISGKGAKMEINPLKDADFDLVELRDDGNIGRETPHCKEHGAMLKLTDSGIWRCMTTYVWDFSNPKNIRFKGNDCTAGCEEAKT